MGAQQVELQVGQILVGDPCLGELAEARVDAVDRLAPCKDFSDRAGATRNPGAFGFADLNPYRTAMGGAQIVEGEGRTGNLDQGRGHGCHSASRLSAAR